MQMTRIPQITIFLVIFFFSLTAYSSSPLPEFYGIFIQDRGRLTTLELNMPEEQRRNFSTYAIIIIHDKRLRSGLANPNEMVRILNRKYVRYNVKTVLEQKNASPKKINITSANNFGAFGEGLKLLTGPIKDQMEMVKIKPKEPFLPGMYYVEFDEKRYPFAVELGRTPEKNNPLNGSLDKWYSMRDKNGTYKSSNILDDEARKWRKDAFTAKNENRWNDLLVYAKNLLALKPSDEELKKLVQIAKEENRKMAEKRAREAEEARLKQRQAEHEQLLSVLESGKSYFGQEATRTAFAFRITFNSFNKESKTFQGIMDYYPENDRAILSFNGKLEGSTLTLQHTGSVREGKSVPLYKYYYKVVGNRLEGRYSKIDGENDDGNAWINLSEEARKPKEKEVAVIERRLSLIKQSRTSTTIIAKTQSSVRFGYSGPVTLTDVSIRIPEYGGEHEYFFYQITDIEFNHYKHSILDCTVRFKGPSTIGKYARNISPVGDIECKEFYETFHQAWDNWRNKYAEILEGFSTGSHSKKGKKENHVSTNSNKSNLILGRWKSEIGVTEYFKDGTFMLHTVTGEYKKKAGKWNINRDILTLRYYIHPKAYKYEILELSEATYKIVGISVDKNTYNSSRIDSSKQLSVDTTEKYKMDLSKVRVSLVTNYGSFTLELYPKKAPKTVDNFLQYIKDGYYDGTIFHRVISGFMIQGGGLFANMQKKPARAPIHNEGNNGLRNLRGTVAMARSNDPHSSTSQFFINTANNASLDYKGKTAKDWGYCVFGKVVDGMEVIDTLENLPTITNGEFHDVPVNQVIIKSVKVENNIQQSNYTTSRNNEKSDNSNNVSSSVFATNNSNIYHKSDCPELGTKDLMEFGSPKKARNSGGIPCGNCNP